MKQYPQVAAFILAGGASSRMGRDKGLIEIEGVPLIVRTARLVKPLVANVTIVGAPERFGGFGVPVMADRDTAAKERDGRGQGPLVGIASALEASASPWNLIVACDLPYLTRDWLSWLLGHVTHSQAQILVPRTSRGLEPLAAVYRRECAGPIAAALLRGVRKVTDALAGLQVQAVNASEWRGIDPDGRVLSNMNTPEDFDEARAWWESQKTEARNTKRLRKREAAPRQNKR